jgi:murein DD-endopeptidase MepM/ murein hydrolase activator NlpD
VARLVNPWPAGRTINPNGKYGWRTHPITGRRAFHTGVDVGGTYPVTVAADGTVVHIGWNPSGGGHTVVIDHGDIHTAYFHGREATRLKRGQKVKAGDHIFTSGATGIATGPHLHFEVRLKQAQSTHVDPTPYLPGGKPVPPTPSKLVEDGILGRNTWRAVQTVLKDKGFYTGTIDGVAGRTTILALQKALNAGAL